MTFDAADETTPPETIATGATAHIKGDVALDSESVFRAVPAPQSSMSTDRGMSVGDYRRACTSSARYRPYEFILNFAASASS